MYIFDEAGKFTKSEAGGENIYEAALQRLEDLLHLISDEAELEVDYHADDNSWITMEYYPEREQAVEFADTCGNPVVAFAEVPYDIMIDILNKSDVWYVG